MYRREAYTIIKKAIKSSTTNHKTQWAPRVPGTRRAPTSIHLQTNEQVFRTFFKAGTDGAIWTMQGVCVCVTSLAGTLTNRALAGDCTRSRVFPKDLSGWAESNGSRCGGPIFLFCLVLRLCACKCHRWQCKMQLELGSNYQAAVVLAKCHPTAAFLSLTSLLPLFQQTHVAKP